LNDQLGLEVLFISWSSLG